MSNYNGNILIGAGVSNGIRSAGDYLGNVKTVRGGITSKYFNRVFDDVKGGFHTWVTENFPDQSGAHYDGPGVYESDCSDFTYKVGK